MPRLTQDGRLHLPALGAGEAGEIPGLESGGSILGPWKPFADWTRSTNQGQIEFEFPLPAQAGTTFYRFNRSRPAQPMVKYVSPRASVSRGQSISFFGRNFDADPALNKVAFRWDTNSWTGQVLEAASDYLVVSVPTNLVVDAIAGKTSYRVSVENSRGASAEVACEVSSMDIKFSKNFDARPNNATIVPAPGSATEYFIIGGGNPPYAVLPVQEFQRTNWTIELKGPVLKVVAKPHMRSGGVSITVRDSSTPAPSQRTVSVVVIDPENKSGQPTVSAFPHTSKAATSAGWTARVDVPTSAYRYEKIEMEWDNVTFSFQGIRPGSEVGFVRVFDSYRTTILHQRQVFQVTKAESGRIQFDVVAMDNERRQVIAQGEITQAPPRLTVSIPGQVPESVYPQLFSQELIFPDGLILLPEQPDQTVSLRTRFTTVSLREDGDLPFFLLRTNSFKTTSGIAGAPVIGKLIPTRGEIFRTVTIVGAGFGPRPEDNEVTFSGPEKTRVRAEVLSSTNGVLAVVVPRNAVSGSVQVSSMGKLSNEHFFGVRFHPVAHLLLESLRGGTPAAPAFIHNLPPDEGEYMDEVPVESIVSSVSAGRLNVEGLIKDQKVGNTYLVSAYRAGRSTNNIYYAGKDTNGVVRHIFEVGSSPSSSIKLARIYAHDDPDGDGVGFEIVSGTTSLPIGPGVSWTHQFQFPLVRPPPASGVEVRFRTEIVSKPWFPQPESEMRVIYNTNRRTE